ncbi:MAG: hypothetical protein WC241_02965 [Candidatus Paceibacterota bacterium]|jgi:hypothetical protein
MKKLLYFLLIFVGLICSPDLAKSQTKNIDCGCAPITPSTWKVVSHKSEGVYALDPANVKLIFFKDDTVDGSEILSKVKDIGLNACVLDYLMFHQELIPESWKTKHVVFPGTTFADSDGNELIRFLKWWDGRWVIESIYVKSRVYDDKFVATK